MSEPSQPSRRERIREIIFEAETPAGRRFDVTLLWLIGLSVICVMLESVPAIKRDYAGPLQVVEWSFTILFTLEYLLRLSVVRHPLRYARSFYGIIDVLSVLPTYLMVFFPGMQALLVIRVLRMLRMFRVFKMVRHVNGAELLVRALYGARAKITVFFSFMVAISVIAGTLMYLVEGPHGDFTSIPTSVYWAVVTITTLGFGDITPVTAFGRFLTSALALTGYAVIAVPTGILTTELAKLDGDDSSEACPSCGVHGHLPDARFCRRCGAPMS
ncbi:ion transporter [Luteolibacter flavescens]|uniref:Ion transporter n=1 Tax=Luteolibacter flavescens TaxID=1859460 RepID=A0ABT3FUZ1_9BACT|nr:ion transporter [Luteolibacter flavescens]MCW1886795.1 ion transporter [Luteolibacter flavescens]